MKPLILTLFALSGILLYYGIPMLFVEAGTWHAICSIGFTVIGALFGIAGLICCLQAYDNMTKDWEDDQRA